MRHKRKFNHLSRKSAHRKAMLANMATSLIMHKRIKTTLAKAKALRTYVEPLITKSKDDTTHSRRIVFSYLQNKEAVTELFREVSTKVAERPGGYTRILKLGPRLGDSAEMALIELVDYNENLLGDKVAKKTKTSRRGRRGAAKKKEETTVPAAETTVKEEPETAVETAPATEDVKEEIAEEEKVTDVVEEVKEEVGEEETVTEEEKKEEGQPEAIAMTEPGKPEQDTTEEPVKEETKEIPEASAEKDEEEKDEEEQDKGDDKTPEASADDEEKKA